ncbi:MAG: hypothetical protein ACTS5G_01155 [Burkholderiales bacterium]
MALAISVGLHFGFVAVLVPSMNGSLEDAMQGQNAIEIVFVDRPSNLAQVTQTETLGSMRHHPVVQRQSPKLGSRAKAMSASDDLPDVASTSATRLNLAIAPAEIDFRRNLVERPAPRLEATIIRLQIRMLDTSLGGRLQGMAQSRICGELRSALTRHWESTASIMSAIQRHGCAI